MALSADDARGIAALARLRFAPEEEARLVGQLGRIVAYIDQLAGHRATPPEPGAAAPGREAADLPAPCLPRPAFLANAPESLDGFLVVPQVTGPARPGGGRDA